MLRRICLICCSTALGTVVSVACAQESPNPLPPVFETGWRGFVTGTSLESDPWFPFDQTIADLDGDGDLDVAVANRGNFVVHQISVLLNQGDGFFAAPVFYTIADDGEAITSADFDGDGDIDLLASEDGPNDQRGTVALLRNSGVGTFGAREGITVHPTDGPTGLAVGDLDGDGDTDFVSANTGRLANGTTVSIRFNDGAGVFLEGPILTTTEGPDGIVIADLRGSALPEIIVATKEGRLEIFEHQGGLYVRETLQLPVNGFNLYSDVRVADHDGDGDLDIGVSGLGIQQNGLRGVAVLLNRGGAFGGATVYPFGNFASAASQIDFGDFTGDGLVDIVAVTQAGDEWYTLEGNGDGTFQSGVVHISGEYPRAVDLADIDNDGDLDAIIAAEMSNGLYIHENEGGAFAFPYEKSGDSTFDNLSIASGDIDNDGDVDVISGGVRFNVFSNEGNGEYSDRVKYFPGDGRDSQEMSLRDLNDDGYLDMLWINRDETPPYNFHTALNDGTGAFGPATTWHIDSCGNEDIDAHDLDLDGDLDVVVTEWLACVNVPGSGRRLFIGRNLGDGSFELLPPIVLPHSHPAAVAFGDFDKDGVPDLALGTNPLSIGLGNGDMTFEFIEIGGLGIDVDVADLDADGNQDVVSMVVENTSYLPGAGVLLGRGDGTFSTMETFLTSSSPNLRTGTKVEVGDYDGDGILDLATVNTASHDISFLKGLGDGGYESEVRFGLGEGPIDLTTGDFNGDGVDDLAAPHTLLKTQSGGGVRWLFATGTDACPADFNDDGDVNTLDVLTFLNAWNAGEGRADFNEDGQINTLDVLDFLNAWNAGC